MKVNISLRPRTDIEYDLHLPVPLIVTPSQDPKINATEKQILETFSKVNKSTELVIGENGGPPAWSERIAKVLIKHGYKNVTVNQEFDLNYFKNSCEMFPNPLQPYRYIKNQEIIPIIKDFFNFYKSQKWTIEEPAKGVTGHYYRGRMLWTQMQKIADIKNSKNLELMSHMKNMLPKITDFLKQCLLKYNMNFSKIDDRVTLRLVDYVNTPGINETLGSHIDASLITGVLYEDHPGLHVRDYLDNSLSINNSKIIEIDEILEQGNAVFFPGNILCDELRTWAPACWHGVQMSNKVQRRLSFLVRIESLDL